MKTSVLRFSGAPLLFVFMQPLLLWGRRAVLSASALLISLQIAAAQQANVTGVVVSSPGYCAAPLPIDVEVELLNLCYSLNGINTVTVNGNAITITIGYNFNPGYCASVVVFETVSVDAGYLMPGTYSIAARLSGSKGSGATVTTSVTVNCDGAPCSAPDVINLSKICSGTAQVCGCDGVTYANACTAFYKNGITSWTTGPCATPCGGNPAMVTITGGNAICNGASATLTANATGSTGPYTYVWSNAATTSSIAPAPTSTTTYTVTVTSSTGCTATSSRTVTVAPAIAINNITTNNLNGTFRIQGGQPQSSGGNYSSVVMALFNNPAVTATLTTAPFTHNETVSFTVPQSGAYVVTVTDGAGCTGTAMITPVTCNPVSDSLELVKLYNATNGPGWTNKTNWLVPGQPISSWYGVQVNGSGCVTCIDLDGNPGCSTLDFNGNNLIGILPDLNLPNLQNLSLSVNKLIGSIPNFNLPNLEGLYLYDNQLSGPIPNFNLPNLKNLSLSFNQLNDSIPNFNLPNLQDLYLSYNQLSGSIPDFNLPNLKNLQLLNNELSGSIPNFNLPKLQDLHLSDNELSGPIPNFNLPNLLILHLYNNELIGSIPNLNLPNLIYLTLNNNQLSGSIPNFHLPNLEWLYLYDNQLSGSIPNFNLPNLKYLLLSGNQLSGLIPNFNLPNLQQLWLNNNELSDLIPNFDLPNLKWFLCNNNQLSGAIPNFNLPNLQELHLSYNQLSGAIPNFNLPKLTGLRLVNNNLSAAALFNQMPLMGTGTSSLDSLTLQFNRLTFDDILPNMPLINGFYNNQARYAPQDSIFSDTLITRNAGQALTIDLGIDATVPDNIYAWYKNGSPWTPPAGNAVNSNKLIFSALQNSDAGVYHVQVTNPGAPALTLYSRAIRININTAATCNPVSDSLELVKLYNATGGPGWTNKTNWLVPGMPISTWYGITVNGDGCVTGISLISNQLNGAIPELALPNLEILYLSYNQLNGSIPNFNLPNLEFFICNNNQLSGSIPNFNLPNLQFLFCSYNQLSGSIPNFNLPNLQEIDLNNNQVSGSIPNFSLPNLRNLTLYRNQLSGSIPNFSLPNLQVLHLHFNQLSGTIPNFSLPNLQALTLSHNQLSGSIPDFSLPNLQFIEFNNNQLSGSIPNFSLPNLQVLHLHFNQLSGSIPNFNLPNLQSFWCFNNQLSGTIPNFNLPNLEYLYLFTNQLSGTIPNFNLPKLFRLWLSNNNLSVAPTFTQMPLLGTGTLVSDSLTLYNNHLTFDDILPNMPLINGFYNNQARYAPQDSIFSDTLITRNAGQALTIDLGIDAAVPDNIYAWYKNGSPWTPPAGNAANSNKLIFSALQNSDAGIYHVQVTNPGAPALTLYSRAITINIVATTCAVTTTADAGPGSLREAINCANSNPGPDTIRFNIPGAGPHVISLLSILPDIKDNGTRIDASTQPNWQPGMVVIDGNLITDYERMLYSSKDSISLCGLTFRNGPGRGLALQSVDVFSVSDCYFYGNGRLDPNVPNNKVVPNLQLWGCTNGSVKNCVFGITETGTLVTNTTAYGITASGVNIQIGGSRANSEGNTFGGHTQAGIGLWLIQPSPNIPTQNIQIYGNNIGTNAAGTADWGNYAALDMGSNVGPVSMGHNSADLANTIRFNNYIQTLYGGGAKQIAYGQNNISCNDSVFQVCTCFPDRPVNIDTATPALLSGTGVAGDTVALYISDDTGCTDAPCQGKTYLGSALVNAGGAWTLNAPFAATLPAGSKVTAISTGNNGYSGYFSDCATVTNASCNPAAERAALEALYDATNGDSWTIKTNWKTAAPVGTWYGIQVNANGCVQCIDMDGGASLCSLDVTSGNNMTGSLPIEIGELSQLTYLNLNNNLLGGIIPAEIGNLALLETLLLDNNNLIGTIPNSLYQLTDLQVLGLNTNQLGGQLSPLIGNLSKLRLLSIGSNMLTGNIPDQVGSLPLLKQAFFNFNQFTGAIPNTINLNTNLNTLFINYNKLSQAPDLSSLPFKQDSTSNPLYFAGLRMGNNAFTFDDIIPNIAALSQLTGNFEIRYAPQDSIFSDTLITRNAGQTLTIDLGIDAGLTTNVYQWHKNGSPWTPPAGNAVNSNKLIFNDLQNSDAGVYHVQVTNPGAPALTLYSRAIQVEVQGASCPQESSITYWGTIICTDENDYTRHFGIACTDCGRVLSPTTNVGTIVLDPVNPGIVDLINVPYGVPINFTFSLENVNTGETCGPYNHTFDAIAGPTESITSSGGNVLCSGETTILSIPAEASATYTWYRNGVAISNSNANQINTNQGGTYEVTWGVFPAICVSRSIPITLTQSASPTPALSANTPCPGGTLTLQDNSGTAIAWSWSGPQGYTFGSNPATRDNMSAAFTGTYSVTATNAEGCTATSNIQVAQIGVNPIVNLTPQNATCDQANGSINLAASGGNGPFSFDWEDLPGSSDPQQRALLPAGNYSVTVSNAQGCTASATTTIDNIYNFPELNTSAQSAGCNLNTGSITLTIQNGIGPFVFEWSNGSNTQNLNNVSPDVYTVTVTGSNGCTASATDVVDQMGILPFIDATTQPAACGQSDGSITLTVSGGTAPFNYDWADLPGSNNPQNRTALPAGTYTVTVTNAEGCTASNAITVGQSGVTPVINATTQPAACGQSNGSITLTVSGGTAPFNYDWADLPGSNNPQNRTAIPSGNYTVTVTNAEGCTSVQNITVAVSTGGVSLSRTEIICGGDVYVAGNQTFSTSGTYTVILPAQGAACDTTLTLNLSVLPPVSVALTASRLNICKGDSTLLKTTVANCTNCSYQWSNNNNSSSSQVVAPESSTTYKVTVTQSGLLVCNAAAELSISVSPNYELVLDTVICAGNSVKIGNQLFSNTGLFTVELQTGQGCDSVIQLNLERIDPGALLAFPDTIFLVQGSGSTELLVTENDTLPSLDSILLAIKTLPLAGSVAIIDNRRLRYSPPGADFLGTDVFTYTIGSNTCPAVLDSARVTIIVQGALEDLSKAMPNVITPNGDGMNDDFDPLQVYREQGNFIPEDQVRLVIINRMNEVVHVAKPYEKWIGTYGNQPDAKALPSGVYKYVLELSLPGQHKYITGAISIAD